MAWLLQVMAAHASFVSAAAVVLSGERHGLSTSTAPDRYLSWLLCGTTVHQNLGGLGPDSGEAALIFSDVGTFHGQSVDLVIVNLTAFKTSAPQRNGRRGCIGRINVARNTSVTIQGSFRFANASDLGPVADFDVAVLDLDIGVRSNTVESVVAFEPLRSWSTGSNVVVEPAQDGVLYTASGRGDGSNNPPWISGADAFKPDVVPFRDGNFVGLAAPLTDSFTLTLAAGSPQPGGGRNFFFSGGVAGTSPRHWPNNDRTRTTTTTTTVCDSSSCVVWGDPHVLSFDAHRARQLRHPRREAFFRTRGWRDDQLTVTEEGTFWLVRSAAVRIQGRYERGRGRNATALVEVSIGGPFLNGSVLVLRPTEATSTWNGEEILPPREKGTTEFANAWVSAVDREDAQLVKDGTRGRGVEIALPLGVRLIVNRWKASLACQITMCRPAESLAGQCGDFDGRVEAKDFHGGARPEAREFLVAQRQG